MRILYPTLAHLPGPGLPPGLSAGAPAVAGLAVNSISAGWPSPYFATQNSGQRQPLNTFGEDPRKMLTQWTRTEMMLIARTLFANYGGARAIGTTTKIIGSLKPQARSGNTSYDAILETEFRRVAESPLLFDLARERTFYDWQPGLTQCRFVDGDFFSLLVRGPYGPAFAGRESHCVKSGKNAGPLWHDGILTDGNNGTLAYQFVDFLRPDVILPPTPANAVHHSTDRDFFSGKRSPSALAHALNNWRDIIETRSFMKQAIKMAAMIGVTRKQDAAHGSSITNHGLGSPTYTTPFIQPGATPPATAAEAADLPRVRFEDFISAGIFSQVPLDTLHDDRPHPNVIEFQKELLREAGNGLGVPPQILYLMDEPGGAWTRVLLEIFAKWILHQHVTQLRPFCQRVWNFVIASAIVAGRIPEPPGGADYTRVRWCPPRSLTADMGRIGALAIKLREALMTTYAAWYEENGLDWEEELSQSSLELKKIKELEQRDGHQPGELAAALRSANWVDPNAPAPGTPAAGVGNQPSGLESGPVPQSLEEKVDWLMERYRPAA